MDSNEFHPVRIGDAERNDAVELLQGHMTEGRLEPEEFSDRIERALSAKTRDDLTALFTDLPGRRPGEVAIPHTSGSTVAPPENPPAPVTPWYAQPWLFFVVIALTAVSSGRLGILVPIMAIWVWWIYPTYFRDNRPVPPSRPSPELNSYQIQQINAQLQIGHRIHAIKLYRQFTGAELVEAKQAIDRWDRELGA